MVKCTCDSELQPFWILAEVHLLSPDPSGICSHHWEAADCLQHLNKRSFTHVVLSPEPPVELSAEPVEMVFESQMGLEPQAVETGRRVS